MLNFTQFKAQMLRQRSDNFTQRGLKALYELLTERYPHSINRDSVDVIAICCTWEEVSVKEFAERYPHEKMTSHQWSQLMQGLNGIQISKFKFIVRNM